MTAPTAAGGVGARRLVVVGVLLVAPIVGLAVSPWDANGSLFYLGLLPAAIGLLVSTRVALGASVLTSCLMAAALPLRDHAVPGALLMAAIGALVGLSSRRGWHGVGAFAGPLVALALIGAPQVALPSGTVAADSSATSSLALGGWVVAGGLWTIVLGRPVVAAVHPPHPPAVGMRTARYFEVTLAVLAGGSAYFAMRWVGSPNAWWILLTLFVIVQPYYAATLKRAAQRVVGTVVGAVVAALVVEALDGRQLAVTLVALALTVVAAWAYMTRPYWIFVLFLTPAVILQTGGTTHDVLQTDLDRAVFTVGAAIVAVVVLTAGHRVIDHQRARSRTR